MSVRTALFTGLLLCSAARAADEPASEIARRSREQGALNLLNLTAILKLTTVDKAGRSKEQVLTTSTKKIAGRNHSIARFSSPASVAGVGVLTIQGKNAESTETSLYLPKLRRVRKIASSQRAQSFMDTDFNYADLGGAGTDDASVKRLANKKVDGRDAYVISGPGAADSSYGEVVVYVDKQSYVPLQAEYKDKDGKPFKRYRTLKLTESHGRTLAALSTMENLQSGSKTTVELVQVAESKLGDEAFSERALERG